MKQNQLLVKILLIILIVAGWASTFTESTKAKEKEKEYNSHLELAKEYFDRELLQKAIEEYKKAISIAGTEEDWTNMLNIYQQRYSETTQIYDEYLESVKQAAETFGENEEFVGTLVKLYTDQKDYKDAYKFLLYAIENNTENGGFNSLMKEVKYAYELGWKTYTDYRSFVNDMYVLDDLGVWTYASLDGEEVRNSNYAYAGLIGENGIHLINDGDRTRLIDNEEIIQGYLDFYPEEAGVYSHDLIPIKYNGEYAYYNSLGDKQFGNFSYASTFADGKAAVVNEEEWWLIDNQGNKVSSNTYEDIVLNTDGTAIKDGIMIAKKDGVYRLYDDMEKQISDFQCDNIDVVANDNLIAFCREGKWGYVDYNGNEIIEPTYVEAKSFSNGLAAVSNGKTWGFIDKNGEIVIDYTFMDVDYFNSEGVCMVMTDEDKWQFLSLYINE